MDTTNLPLDYLCVLLERQFPHGFALSESPYIALYLPVRKGEDSESVFSKLEEMAEHISLRAGISFAFKDILDARHYFHQAVHALEMAVLQGGGGALWHFRDYALPYALKNSVGELSAKYMVPPDLLLLKNNDDKPGGADYWETLKVYLDNEMNATQTADDLFIHRTTLRMRLNKIKKVVDLSTPLSRMYVRYCLYLYETLGPLDE
jgi:DNA-binding PucR family transcriptional regulator